MNFYYEGQLIRSSKNHHYAYACVIKVGEKWHCLGCSSSKAGAERVKKDKIREYERSIDSCDRAIKAYEEGKSGYYSRNHEWVTFKNYGMFASKEDAEYRRADLQRSLDSVKANWIIVEVEEA